MVLSPERNVNANTACERRLHLLTKARDDPSERAVFPDKSGSSVSRVSTETRRPPPESVHVRWAVTDAAVFQGTFNESCQDCSPSLPAR